jgi:hypothetical protein
MKVDFPHPESAARPITIGLSTAHVTWKVLAPFLVLLLLLLLAVKRMTWFCLKPEFGMEVRGECRDVVVCGLQNAMFAAQPWLRFGAALLPFKPCNWDLRRRERA